MKCRECKHWIPEKFNSQLLPDDHTGKCEEIMGALDVEIISGPNGACIESIEVAQDFFCARFESK